MNKNGVRFRTLIFFAMFICAIVLLATAEEYYGSEKDTRIAVGSVMLVCLILIFIFLKLNRGKSIIEILFG